MTTVICVAKQAMMNDVQTRSNPGNRVERAPSPLRLERLFAEEDSLTVEAPRLLRAGDCLLFGRGVDPRDGWALSDSLSSRRHAALIIDLEAVRVRDLGSKNGTFIDGQRVQGEAWLRPDQILRTGGTLFVLRRAPLDLLDGEVPGLIGRAPKTRAARAEVARLARTQDDVLIQGESGTGKELIARALHQQSGRRGPFVPVNTTTLPETLASSLLFGNRRRIATDMEAQRGLFRDAQHGTLFLDEIGDLAPKIQAMLLRVLDSHEVLSLGEALPEHIDVRVVAATHQDLDAAVAVATFRLDLLMRLRRQTLSVPPLRERQEDILHLLAHFLRAAPRLTAEQAERLLLHPWPGNVRGVEALANRLAPLSPAAFDDALHSWLDADRRVYGLAAHTSAAKGAEGPMAPSPPLPPRLPRPQQKISKNQLREAITEWDGNIVKIAAHYGQSRRNILRRIEKLGLLPDLEARRGEVEAAKHAEPDDDDPPCGRPVPKEGSQPS